MPLPTQQLQALTDAVAAAGQAYGQLSALVSAIPVESAADTAELDAVNAQLEAINRAVRIALSVAADESRPVGERVVLIQETLQETQE